MSRELKIKRWLKILLIGGLFLFIFIYGLARSVAIFLGPEIILKSPQNALVTSYGFIEVEGQAKRIAKIYLNGRQIFTNSDGEFKEPLLLSPGYNILYLMASDIFNRKVTETVEVVYQPKKM